MFVKLAQLQLPGYFLFAADFPRNGSAHVFPPLMLRNHSFLAYLTQRLKRPIMACHAPTWRLISTFYSYFWTFIQICLRSHLGNPIVQEIYGVYTAIFLFDTYFRFNDFFLRSFFLARAAITSFSYRTGRATFVSISPVFQRHLHFDEAFEPTFGFHLGLCFFLLPHFLLYGIAVIKLTAYDVSRYVFFKSQKLIIPGYLWQRNLIF